MAKPKKHREQAPPPRFPFRVDVTSRWTEHGVPKSAPTTYWFATEEQRAWFIDGTWPDKVTS